MNASTLLGNNGHEDMCAIVSSARASGMRGTHQELIWNAHVMAVDVCVAITREDDMVLSSRACFCFARKQSVSTGTGRGELDSHKDANECKLNE